MRIAIIGLGYVGLPLALEFAKKYQVVGFDINLDRIDELRNGIDRTNETTSVEIQKVLNKDSCGIGLSLTSNVDFIKESYFQAIDGRTVHFSCQKKYETELIKNK